MKQYNWFLESDVAEIFSDIVSKLKQEKVQELSLAQIVVVKSQQFLKENDMHDKLVLAHRSDVDEYEFFKAGGHILITDEMAVSLNSLELTLVRFLDGVQSTNLKENFNGAFDKSYKKRIMGHLRLGYHLDHIVADFFEQGYEPIYLREYVDKVIYYLSYLRNAGITGFPLEIEYGIGNNFAGLSIVCSCSYFEPNFLFRSMNDNENLKGPLSTLIYKAKNSSHMMDILYLEEAKKLVISATWWKKGYEHNIFFGVKSHTRGIIPAELKTVPSPTLRVKDQEVLEELEDKDFKDNDLRKELDIDFEVEELKNKLFEDEEYQKSFSQELAQELVHRIGGAIVEKDRDWVVKTLEQESKSNMQLIKGSAEDKKKARGMLVESLSKKLVDIDKEELESFVESTVERLKNRDDQKITQQVIKEKAIKDGDGETKDAYAHFNEKLDQKEKEISTLKNKIKTLFNELKSNESANEIAKKVNEQVSSDLEELNTDDLKVEIERQQSLIDALEENEKLSSSQKQELMQALNEQVELEKEKKQVEINLRKVEIETRQKEALYLQQIQAKERVLKGRDTVIEKMKESMSRLTDSKNKQIDALNDRISALNSQMSNYKNEADKLSKSNKDADEAKYKAVVQELREFKEKHIILDKELLSKTKEVERATKLLSDFKQALETSKMQTNELTKKNEEYSSELEQLKKANEDQSKNSNLTELAKTKSDLITGQKMIKALEIKLQKAEAMAAQGTKANSSSNNRGSSGVDKQTQMKLDRLEKDRTKLMDEVRSKNKELADSQLQFKKANAENRALQNKLQLLEREVAKLKEQSGKSAA